MMDGKCRRTAVILKQLLVLEDVNNTRNIQSDSNNCRRESIKEEDLNRRRQSEPILQIPPPHSSKNLNTSCASESSAKKPAVVPDQKASIQIRLRSRNAEPRRSVSMAAATIKSSSEEEEEEEEEDDENDMPISGIEKASTPVRIQRFESKNVADPSSTDSTSKILVLKDGYDSSAPVTSFASGKFDSTTPSSIPIRSSSSRIVQDSSAVVASSWKKYLMSEEPATDRSNNFASVHASSNASHNSSGNVAAGIYDNIKHVHDHHHHAHSVNTTSSKRSGSNSILVEPDPAKSSSRESVDSDLSWNEKRRRFVRSKTNPELSSDSHDSPTPTDTNPFPKVHQPQRYRHRLSDFVSGIGTGNNNNNDAVGIVTVEKRRSFHELQDNAPVPPPIGNSIVYGQGRGGREADRRNRYKRKAEKSHSGCGYVTHSADDEIGMLSGRDPIGRSESSSLNVPGPGSKYYRALSGSKIDYTLKGKMFMKFGCKGSLEGQFNWPRGVSVFPATGELVVCDSSNHRLQIFDRRGNVLKSIGAYGSARGEFDCLAGVCVNKYHQFVVSDRYNHRIQIFDSNGRHLREFGSHGQSNGRFHSPWGVVVDAQGFIYVCDKDNHRIQIFQADGSFVGKFGVLGNREGQFQNPHFVAVNRQNHLIVTDSNNHRVQVFDHDGHFLFAFGSEGFHDGQFKYPRGVTVDDQGIIIVADSGNNRVQMFWPDGRFYTTFGCWGSLDGQMKGVEGVAVTEDGHIIVTDRDNHRVQIF